MTATSTLATDGLPDVSPERARRYLDDFRTVCTDARQESLLVRKYYDGDQLNATVKAALKRRKQPEMIINYVRAAVNGTVGIVIQNPTDPRAYARQPDKQGAADVASMTLRYVADTNHFDQIKADTLENGVIEGCYAVTVECAPDEDVQITTVRWEEFFYDPHSRQADFSDAKYLGIAKWMYADQLRVLYPDHEDMFAGFVGGGYFGGMISGWGDNTWLDRPDTATPWVDSERKRLMVAECYYLEGRKWYRCVFCAGGILEHGESAYLDDKGATACPIVAASAYVDSQNFRYGPARDLMSIQDGINMRESKLMHLLNSRQVQRVDPDAAPVDAELAKTEAAKPDGVLPPGWNIVTGLDTTIAGQAQLLAEAKQEILRMSPNPALVGRGGEDASGRAVQIRQQAGLTELARVLGRRDDWELRVFKRSWGCCKQFWTAKKWIRVNDDDGAPSYILLNDDGPQPVKGPDGAPMQGPDGQPVMQPPQPAVDPQTGQPVIDPATGQPQIHPANHIASMDVDIIVDSVPSSPDLQSERDQSFLKLIGSNPQWVAQTPLSLVLQTFWEGPEKRDTIKAFQEQEAKAQAAQQAAQAAQQQQLQMQLQIAQANAQAGIAKTQSETEKNLATARKTDIQGTSEALAAHISADQALQPPVAGDQSGVSGVAAP